MKLLILGGYGVFGGRLAQVLAGADLQILIAGRKLAKAQGFAALHPGTEPIKADRATVAETLRIYHPDILVDASSPFQTYGTDPYSVLRACIDSHTNYLDFADGADFVNGVGQFDAEAKAARIFALSGVSSFPVLTAAVLREMAKTMEIEEVTGGIAPSPHAGVGLNVLRAVLGYAGQPVNLIRNGQPTIARGLAETLRYTVAPPGALPLHNTLFSLADVPDLRAIPAALPQIRSLWMGAGPLPEPLHRLLITLAKLPLPNLAPIAPLAYKVLNALTYGEHRGGVFIEEKGTAQGQPVTRSWHMLAEGDDGPLIPSMATCALIRQTRAGHPPAPGARSGIDALSLHDYETLFQSRAITTGWRDAPQGSIYQQVLGPAFASLAPQLQALHRPGPRAEWAGRAKVTRGKPRLANLVATLFSFPKAGDDIPVSVTFLTAPDRRETWGRNFAGRLMVSTQEAGTRRNQHLITERFGPFAFGLAIVCDAEKLRIIPRRWSVFGLPLPRALCRAATVMKPKRTEDSTFMSRLPCP